MKGREQRLTTMSWRVRGMKSTISLGILTTNLKQVLSDVRESVELWGDDGRKSNIEGDMKRVTLLSIDNMGVNETVEVEVSNRDKEDGNEGSDETAEVMGRDNTTAGKELVEITKRILKRST
ncbi:hypothetical protein GOBAR_DD18931 [Gossypium barbadense]|nr:hypothetical protein GOBAR_DD18931 [Gossypium barbadense]